MNDQIIPKKYFLGMFTRNPETKNNPNNAWIAWNMKITGTSCEPVLGFKQFANRLSTEGRIRDAYTFILRDGTEIPIRVRDDGNYNNVEWYESGSEKWNVLIKTLTGQTICFQDYNGSTYNYLIFGDGHSPYTIWTGKRTRLISSVSLHDTQLHVSDTTDFQKHSMTLTSAVSLHDVTIHVNSIDSSVPGTGYIYYNGQSIAYSARDTSAKTFTVVDAHASAGSSDTVYQASGTIIYNGDFITYERVDFGNNIIYVADAHASAGSDDGVAEYPDVNTGGGFANSNIMISAQNRIWMLHSGARLDYSKEGDALDYTSGANRADAGQEDFPIVGGRGTGLAAKDEYIFIFKERTIISFKWDYPSNTTKTPNFKHLVVGDGQGAINHKGIANIYDEILYASEKGIKSLTKQLNTGFWQPGAITDIISETIKDYDFSEASAFYDSDNDVYLCACKSDKNQTANNRVIAIWYFYIPDSNGNLSRTYGISVLDITADCFFRYDKKLYFGSSMEPNCYELFTGNTRNGATMTCIYTDNRNDYGKKSIKNGSLYFIDGFLKAGTTVKIKFIFDGGRSGTQEVEIPDTGDHISESNLNTLGAYELGAEVIGGLFDDASDLKPFNAVIELQNTNFFDLQVERKTDSKGGYFRIIQEGLVNPSETNNLTSNI